MEPLNELANLIISFRNKEALQLSLSDLVKKDANTVVQMSNSLKELIPFYERRVEQKTYKKSSKTRTFSTLNEKISTELEKLRTPYSNIYPDKTIDNCKAISNAVNGSINAMNDEEYQGIVENLKEMEANITIIPLIIYKVRAEFYRHLEKFHDRKTIASKFNISKRSLENYASFNKLIDLYPQLLRTNLTFTTLITNKRYILRKINSDPDLELICKRNLF